MSNFVGREQELSLLEAQFKRVQDAVGHATPGRCVFVRGRRRVGKSRLLEQLCDRTAAPAIFFTASHQGAHEPRLFAEEAQRSSPSMHNAFSGVTPESWDGVFRLLANAIDDSTPTVVVIDEFPYLVTDDPSIEATTQKQWDRLLSKKPVLLILVGSDLAMMEALNSHDRPLFQRGTEMIVRPFSPRETAELVGAPTAADAFDAFLLTGGLPLICNEWQSGITLWEYLDEALRDPTSALIVSGERVLNAEFTTEIQARDVLGVIGSGERTFTKIGSEAGLQATSLSRSLDTLIHKRVVARDQPLSRKTSQDSRYRISDTYLRFWLTFIGPHLAEIERGRGDLLLGRVRDRWATWRGRAIEPIVREALRRINPLPANLQAPIVGSYWTRTNVPEIDIVGADREPTAKSISFAGSIKWLKNTPFDDQHLRGLASDVEKLPGGTSSTPLIAVSRGGVTASGLAASFGPDDLIAAW